MIEAIGRGVLDTPLSRSMTTDRGPTAWPSIQHPLGLGAVERKGRHVDLEPLAAFTDHLIASAHEARRGRKRHARGIFEALARREHGLFADHALTAHFLLAARSIGDDPVPRLQLHGLIAGIGDHNGVGPEIAGMFRRRAFGHEVRLDGDFDLAGNGAVHGNPIISKSSAGTNRARRSVVNEGHTNPIVVSTKFQFRTRTAISFDLRNLACKLARKLWTDTMFRSALNTGAR